MSVVRVAVPVLHGRRRFHFDKGRPWSIVEHMLLFELTRKATTAADLALRGNLPRRVVIEALIRLMRAGWVEMTPRASSVIFHATPRGTVASGSDELPNVVRQLSRNMNFVIDQITGTIFRSRELPFTHEHIVKERENQERVVWLSRPNRVLLAEVRPLVEALFNDDEKFVSMDPGGDRMAKRWALVTVRDGEPDGLTSRAPRPLTKAIKEAAKTAPIRPIPDHTMVVEPSLVAVLTQGALPREHQINVTSRDLILGGAEHEEAIKSALRRARYRVFIHSTFIAESRFNDLLPDIRATLRRGVTVDVLWGQDPAIEGTRSTRLAIRKIKSTLKPDDLERLTIHPFSTGSHCKILLSDRGSIKQFSAYVGSCNWLSSDFQSFEASICLRDPAIVADVFDQLVELSKGSRGHWTNLTNDLAALAASLRSLDRLPPGRARASVVVGMRHADLVRQARDESQRRIFVTSHRFGVAGQSAVLAPALAAAKSRGVDATVFYGTTSGALRGVGAAKLTREAFKGGVTIQPIRKPRVHAKLIAWDDDAIVITSQNWLSADPPDDKPRQEIGIFVRAPGLASSMIGRFNAARLE